MSEAQICTWIEIESGTKAAQPWKRKGGSERSADLYMDRKLRAEQKLHSHGKGKA